MTRKILVTSALPYANGSIHIGHLVEYLQTDIWVRFQKLIGNDCRYFCADDTHGTPIMIRARKEGKTPEEIIGKMYDEHVKDFAAFDIEFDNFYSTHSDENRELASMIYNRLKEAGHIASREVEQAYCDHDKMFLPDRFIRGICPKCKAEDQYGDSCEVCHATYTPLDLIKPACSICGNAPVQKKSTHFFFKLADFEPQLKEWIGAGHVHQQVANKLQEWFDQGLRDWDISRDAPYFGFEIPGEKDKYFYVWLDAPIGYIASTKNYCDKNGLNWEDYWVNGDAEIHHFIGKDITYFHALFWPAMLMGAGLKTPDRLAIHGFLTVNGEKMSKSRGTFINASTYLNHLDPQYLRYYYFCKLGPDTGDVDLSLDDFVSRVNSDLIGNIVNLASRSAQMLGKNFDGKCGKLSDEGRGLLAGLKAAADEISDNYESRNFATAARKVRALADEVNKYFDERKPWVAIKEDKDHALESLTTTLNAVKVLTTYVKPVLPAHAARIEKLLNIDPLVWANISDELEDHQINKFERLMERVDPKKVEAMVEESKEELAAAQEAEAPKLTGPLADDPIAEEIDFDQFMKVDLRVAEIVEAEIIEEADKLLRFQVDLGGERRQIIAGIRKAYKPEDMVGRKVVIVANLKPRKMKFGMSEGMIIAAGPGGEEVFVTSPDEGAKPGQRLH